jgi:predicted transglutaminase-like cysteine proteinase
LGRVLGLGTLLGLTLAISEAAQADTTELAALQQLTPKLELKSQLLARRFELVLLRHQTTVKKAAAQCEAGERAACRLEDWQEFLAEIANEDEAEQLYRVNRYMNHYRYRSDQRNWRRPDFWAVPEQLFERGGDCEDHAIAKYVSLRALGFPAERLRHMPFSLKTAVAGGIEGMLPGNAAGFEIDTAVPLPVPLPRHDEVIAVAAYPGKEIHLGFRPEMAQFFTAKGDVVAALTNGGQVVLQEYVAELHR